MGTMRDQKVNDDCIRIILIIKIVLVKLMMPKNTNENYVYVDDDYVKKKKKIVIQHIKKILVATKNRQ
jgi:hypothetical protein